MAVAFQRGKTTGPSDLWIMVRDHGGNLVDPYRLEYAVYCVVLGVEVLQGSPVNTAVRISLGHYYAQVTLPGDCQIGLWRIRWTIQERSIDPVYQSVEEFQVIGDNSITSFTGDVNADKLVYSLRILLRDSDPDRNYRFRPPASEKFIQGQTQVFGFVWEDEELYEFLLMAVDDFNSRPPTTGIDLGNLWGTERRWRTTVMVKAAAYALWALAINWIHDEFSVGGEETVTVRCVDGEEATLAIEELYNIVFEEVVQDIRKNIREFDSTLEIVDSSSTEYSKIEDAFHAGSLEIQSLNKVTKEVEWKPIKHVLRHKCPQKQVMRVSTDLGPVIVTEDHSLFDWDTKKEIISKDISVGSNLVAFKGEALAPAKVTSIEVIESRKVMYDLSIPGNENFFLASGILAHNSYSISGVSLDIEKSSKYQSMADSFTAEFDKLVEQNKASIKIIKGLRQQKFGIGITSALGLMSRPGVQSRRNMLSAGYGGLS
jgi:hypothetical protein